MTRANVLITGLLTTTLTTSLIAVLLNRGICDYRIANLRT